MLKSDDIYYGIVAESYDLWFPGPEFEDQEFYRQKIEANRGTALEIGCGTGRLLVPYLQTGLEVEGLDSSEDMLAICREKAGAKAVSPVLHQQYMQELDLPRTYNTIYIPASTFMVLSDRDEGMEALHRFHSHLEPGGQVLISLDIPKRQFESHDRRQWWLRRVATRPRDGAGSRVRHLRPGRSDHDRPLPLRGVTGG